VVICLERGANDLHVVQLMPLPPHHLLFNQNPDWLNLFGFPLPQIDSISAMMIVIWRMQEGRLSGLFCVVLCTTHMQSATNTHMNRTNSCFCWFDLVFLWLHFA